MSDYLEIMEYTKKWIIKNLYYIGNYFYQTYGFPIEMFIELVNEQTLLEKFYFCVNFNLKHKRYESMRKLSNG